MIYKVKHTIFEYDEYGERSKIIEEKIDYVFEKDIRSMQHSYTDGQGNDRLDLEFIQDRDGDWRAPLHVFEIKSL